MQDTVIVTGMHRSGTSFVASVLQKSGIDLGEQLVPPGSGNPRGHFEDAAFVRFHEKILDRGWRPEDQQLPVVTARDREDAVALITERSHKPLWGWKDPRTSLFLELWNELLPCAKWVFVVRDPVSVVNSLHRRDDDGRWWWRADTRRLRWWRFQTLQCLGLAKRHAERCLVLEIGRAVDNFASCSDALSRFLGHPIEEQMFRQHYDNSLFKRRQGFLSVLVNPWDYLGAIRVHRQACRMSPV